ncbi:MAG: ribonuclease Z [Myxococcota bacterium]|jgi:ribonuclease Z
MQSQDLEVAGIGLRAVSVGGKETCIEVPAWRLAFDIGRCPPTAVRARQVLFTHSHVDHMGGVAHHTSLRALQGMSAPRYLLPQEHHANFGTLMDAWRRLDGGELACDVVGVRPGDVVPLGGGRHAHVFRAIHRVAAVGYAIQSHRSRLRPEWQGRPGPEIGAARARGVAIMEEHQCTELAFCGDTTIDVVEREPLVRTAKVLVLECTFLPGGDSLERARRTGHVQLDQIAERADLFENEAVVLTHFSARYSADQIVEALDARLPKHLRDRVTPLLPWVRPA